MFRYPDIQIFRYSDIQIFRLSDIQISRYPDIQKSEYPNTNSFKNRILAKKPGMNKSAKIPGIDPPVAFNPYKHHLGFLKEQIEKWRMQSWSEAAGELLCIGNNLIDLYYGKLTIHAICSQCLAFAEQQNITSSERLAEWIAPLEYRKTELSDTSLWVIKQGTDAGRFLHIHPAKYSPLSLRVRANTLKTVLMLNILSADRQASRLHLDLVNQVRKEYLGLSPIKMLVKGKGIAGLWAVFHQSLNS
jgi:hypothetical protein